MDGYTIIDADTHVTETPDLWTSRAPAAIRDKVPHVEKDADGALAWVMNGVRTVMTPGLTATAGSSDFRSPPKTYEAMHPAAYDADARLKYMDEMGIWAMVLYPNVGGFGAQEFMKLGDAELMLSCVQIYNDFQTEWAAADSRRLLPVTSLPYWDLDASVKEIHRCAAKGHKGILFSGEPNSLGQPFLGDRHWDPLWAAAVEVDLPISFHIGSGNLEDGLLTINKKVQSYGRIKAFTEASVNSFMRNGNHLSELILSGLLIRHPKIKFVSVESGIGWIPFLLEAMDYQFLGNHVRDEHPEFTMLPSEYFARHVYACYWFEQTAPQRLLDAVGVDNVLFETDFPHPTSLYGDEVQARIDAGLSSISAEVKRKILWENARKLYKVDEPTAKDENKRRAPIAA